MTDRNKRSVVTHNNPARSVRPVPAGYPRVTMNTIASCEVTAVRFREFCKARDMLQKGGGQTVSLSALSVGSAPETDTLVEYPISKTRKTSGVGNRLRLIDEWSHVFGLQSPILALCVSRLAYKAI
jgi:hypothetical protein